MAKFAVAFMNLGDNELKIEFVDGKDEIEAFWNSSFLPDKGFGLGREDSLADLQEGLFDQDCVLEVKQLP